MRFASFVYRGEHSWGAIFAQEAAPLDAYWPSLKAAIGDEGLARAAELGSAAARIPLVEIDWLPPIPQPGKILCVGLNYEDHRRETGRAVSGHPTIFTRFADSQTAHEAPMLLPTNSDMLDYEAELAVVIGRGGRFIAATDALPHVAGFSCYNDGSVRDWQRHTSQFTPGKNFPGTGSFGPWLVTPEEFGPIGGQTITCRLNGEIMQQAKLDQMIFPVEELIAYCSAFTPLSPGDVIVSGTPGGVGAARKPPLFMKEGDRVEVEIDGIGRLGNRVKRARD